MLVSRWHALLDALPDAAVVVDPFGEIAFANGRMHELAGYAPGALEGRSIDVLVPEERRSAHRASIAVYVADPASRTMGVGRSTVCLRADGTTFPVDIALAPWPENGWTVAIVRDNSERVRTEQELFRLGTHDSLTGLANRALLLDRLDQVLRRRASDRAAPVVLFVDLDHFKSVNDIDGHAAGDVVLQATAAALVATFRPSDTVARVGGDEFVVVCEATPFDEATSLAERAVDAVVAAVRALPYSASPSVSVSVGLALAEPDEQPNDVIDRADAAMYEAKRAGGGAAVSSGR